jgi:hypothetical protein
MLNSTRIMWINGILFVTILILSVSVIQKDRYLPAEPPLKLAKKTVTELIAQQSGEDAAQDTEFQALGQVNLFDTIIPLPTPSPTPVPTPVPPPPINEVTEFWKLNFVLKSMATFSNIKTQEEWTLKIGEKYEETYRGQKIPVYLDSVDRTAWSATVMIREQGEVQKRSFSMFE